MFLSRPVIFSVPGQTEGTIPVFSGSAWVGLQPGLSGQYLKTLGPGTTPIWDWVEAPTPSDLHEAVKTAVLLVATDKGVGWNYASHALTIYDASYPLGIAANYNCNVALSPGDRIAVVVVAAGATPTADEANGIYVVGSLSGGAWPLTRATDANSASNLTVGALTFLTAAVSPLATGQGLMLAGGGYESALAVWSLVGGGGGSVPSGSAGDVVTLDGVGGEEAIALADLMYRSRRAPATATTPLLWECDGASGDLVNTGSLGAAGNLTAGSNLGRNRLDRDSNNRPISTLGRGVYCDGSIFGQAHGAAGVIPTGASSSISMWCAAIVPSGWTGNQTLIARDYAASGWGPPYIGAMLSLRGGGNAVAHINGSGTYASAEVALPSSSGLIFLGLTYDGSTLSLWADGRLLGTASATGPIDWGGPGEWHLGNNGSNEGFTGTILRAGVEASVWDAARWRKEMNRMLWGWTG